MTPYIYPPHEDHHDPETIPAQRTVTDVPAVSIVYVGPSAVEAENAALHNAIDRLNALMGMIAEDKRRYAAVIQGYESTLRNIRSRAQAGVIVTSPVWAAELFETIDTLAALALMGDAPQERLHDEW